MSAAALLLQGALRVPGWERTSMSGLRLAGLLARNDSCGPG